MARYVTATVWLLSFYLVDVVVSSGVDPWTETGLCILPQGAILVAISHLRALGGTWGSVTNRKDSASISLGTVLLAWTLDIILYFVLTPYVDHLRPGPSAPVQPWNYFCEV
jgi:hypothetical protein